MPTAEIGVSISQWMLRSQRLTERRSYIGFRP